MKTIIFVVVFMTSITAGLSAAKESLYSLKRTVESRNTQMEIVISQN